jgi:hypothetical protein
MPTVEQSLDHEAEVERVLGRLNYGPSLRPFAKVGNSRAERHGKPWNDSLSHFCVSHCFC